MYLAGIWKFNKIVNQNQISTMRLIGCWQPYKLNQVMKNKTFTILAVWLVLFKGMSLQAQTPSDAQLMEAKQACILLDYNFSSFDQYWEGTLKRENQTIATVQRQSVMPMIGVGIFDNLNFFIGVPYIKTKSSEPNGGHFAGVSGFQDLSLAVKYRWLNKKLENILFSSFATVGFSTPITNYLSDYMPYSIGLGAPELNYRLIFQFDTNNDWYIRAAGTYLWRGYTKAEREYYYNNGSYYTPWMDVPNGITAEAVLGMWLLKNSLQLEFNFFRLHSLSGDDIRPYNSAQPTNKVQSSRLGGTVRYYIEKLKVLSVLVYHSRVVDGRNTPEMITTGLGVTYLFNYLKK